MDRQPSTGGPHYPTSIFDLADRFPLGGSRDAQSLAVLFDISHADAHCRVTEALSIKYGTSGIAIYDILTLQDTKATLLLYMPSCLLLSICCDALTQKAAERPLCCMW